MVTKLSYCMSGNKGKKAGFKPDAFQEVFNPLLYQVPEVELTMSGLFESPEQADKKSVSFTQFRNTR